MASSYAHPGVYVEEVPSGARTLTGVATSVTAFVGRARRGPLNRPVRVQSFAEYSRVFGGLWKDATMSYAVSQFFQHGGADALIVRVFRGNAPDSTATARLRTASGALVLEASSPGVWGRALRATVDHETKDPSDELLFNLTVDELDEPGGRRVVSTESFRDVSVSPASPRFIDKVLEEGSALVRVRSAAPAGASPTDGTVTATDRSGDDGAEVTDAEVVGDRADRSGIYALEAADLFNLLCIPPLTRRSDVASSTWAAAAAYCQDRRAILVVDSPAAWTSNAATAIADAAAGVNALRSAIGTDQARNAAVYFPRLRMPDPPSDDGLAELAPCGAVAGIIARTDAQRGVWTAPAGLDASFSGVNGLTCTMTDAQNGVLNPLGLNCLRNFPGAGNVIWGSRTLAGADPLASEWKYLPVRRLALYLEESIYRGTQWVVFEPNDEPLWAQLRLQVGAFMQTLFRSGAFRGASPREAYFVKCDRETTTQADVGSGVVNVVFGFAPLEPAEFVVIRMRRQAGQVAA